MSKHIASQPLQNADTHNLTQNENSSATQSTFQSSSQQKQSSLTTASEVLRLQRTIGNQAVQRMLASRKQGLIQRAPPAALANVPPHAVGVGAAVPDPQSHIPIVQANEVRHTTNGGRALTHYAAPDGTPVLGYPFLAATNQTNGGGQPYNGVRFHLLNGATAGPSQSTNLVPTPATANLNGAWTAFENTLKNLYTTDAIHVEVEVTNWHAANAVANTPANQNLRQNLPFYPQAIQARLWQWDNTLAPPRYEPVPGANPVNLQIPTLPSANAHIAYISQASADFLQSNFNIPRAIAEHLVNAHAYLNTAQAQTAEDGYDVLGDAIGRNQGGVLQNQRAFKQLKTAWPNIQWYLTKTSPPVLRIGPQAQAALRGSYRPRVDY